MASVAKAFLTLHGDSYFSMNTFEYVLGIFSAYTSLNKNFKKRIKIPGISWFQVENRNLL